MLRVCEGIDAGTSSTPAPVVGHGQGAQAARAQTSSSSSVDTFQAPRVRPIRPKPITKSKAMAKPYASPNKTSTPNSTPAPTLPQPPRPILPETTAGPLHIGPMSNAFYPMSYNNGYSASPNVFANMSAMARLPSNRSGPYPTPSSVNQVSRVQEPVAPVQTAPVMTTPAANYGLGSFPGSLTPSQFYQRALIERFPGTNCSLVTCSGCVACHAVRVQTLIALNYPHGTNTGAAFGWPRFPYGFDWPNSDPFVVSSTPPLSGINNSWIQTQFESALRLAPYNDQLYYDLRQKAVNFFNSQVIPQQTLAQSPAIVIGGPGSTGPTSSLSSSPSYCAFSPAARTGTESSVLAATSSLTVVSVTTPPESPQGPTARVSGGNRVYPNQHSGFGQPNSVLEIMNNLYYSPSTQQAAAAPRPSDRPSQ